MADSFFLSAETNCSASDVLFSCANEENVYNATETVDAGSSIKTKNVNTDDIGKIISIFK